MKKLLALVLALVMTLSLCVVSSNAAYTDAADIDYTEAVDVMSAVGVLAGMEDGKFNPTGTLTREQGAKIIAYMLLGKTVGDALTAPKAPFADVAADRWSAGAIAYCVAEGIIAGVGNNQFDPTGELTGYAFAKMALTALGYNAQTEGLVGGDWQINTAKTAIAAGLLKDISTLPMSQPITREQAAQVGFNTLLGTMVYYENQMTVTGTDVNVTTTGIRTEYANTNTEDYRYPSLPGNATLQLIEKTFPKLKKVADLGDFGESAYKWVNDSEKVSTYADSATLVYTAKMYDDDGAKSSFKTDLANYKNSLRATTSVCTNGKSGMLGGNTVDAVANLTGNGKVVEIYTDGTTIDNIVVKAYNLYQVISKTDSLVVFKGVTVTAPRIEVDDDNDSFATLKDLAVGDYAMLAVDSDDEVVGTSTFTTVTGAYTAKPSSTKYTIGGTTYTVAANNDLSKLDTLGTAIEYTAYLDAYGYLTYAKANNKVEGKLAYVLATDVEGSAAKNDYTAIAKLLFTDGSTKTVQVNKFTTASATGAMETALTQTALAQSTDFLLKNNTGLRDAFKTSAIVPGKGVFVKYTENANGTYNLEDVVATAAVTRANDASNSTTLSSSNKDAASKFTLANGESYPCNAGTTLVIKKGSSYTAYNGVKNFPNVAIAANDVNNYGYVNNGYWKFLFVDAATGAQTVSGSGYNYMVIQGFGAASSDMNEDEDTVYSFKNIYYNGAKLTDATAFKAEVSSLASLRDDLGVAPLIGVVYANPTFDNDGYLTSVGTLVDTAMVYATADTAKLQLKDGTLTITAGDWTDAQSIAGDHDVSSDFVCVAMWYKAGATPDNTANAMTSAYVGLDANASVGTYMEDVIGSAYDIAEGAGTTVTITMNEQGEVSACYIVYPDAAATVAP